MARTAVLLSYRLGGTDGVSVEAAKWEWALRTLGFTTRRVAGHLCDEPRPDDLAVPGIDIDAPTGDRDAARAELGFAADELVVLQPTRAIPRKNVPGGFRFAEALAGFVPDRPVVYWLTGPAEDGYDRALSQAMAATTLRV